MNDMMIATTMTILVSIMARMLVAINNNNNNNNNNIIIWNINTMIKTYFTEYQASLMNVDSDDGHNTV